MADQSAIYRDPDPQCVFGICHFVTALLRSGDLDAWTQCASKSIVVTEKKSHHQGATNLQLAHKPIDEMTVTKQKITSWLRLVVGGPVGIVAWSISGASAMAVLIWGLKTVAIPLLMLKTASWGIWGLGVFRESKSRRRLK